MSARSWKFWVFASLVMLIITTPRAEATVIGVGVGAFGAGSTLSTFAGLADSTEVNGLIVNGILYSYSLGNGAVIIDGGPGVTNNINPPNVVSAGNPTGILTLTFPTSESMFGYGYAVLNPVAGPVANATTITLFDGATNVGSLSYNAVPDPGFAGGFAGISSTIPFNRAQLTFNSVAATAFALDNVRTTPVVGAPEPSTVVLLGTGLGLLWFRRRAAGTRL
jgi:PEP-CTERM motif